MSSGIKISKSEAAELFNLDNEFIENLVDASNFITRHFHGSKVDIEELANIKKNTDYNLKISFVPFFIKAIVKTIKDIPIFNSSLSQDGNFIYRKKYFNIGIAVNTDSGLLVPVIKNADTKSI